METNQYLVQDKEHLLQNYGSRTTAFLKGQGSYLYDADNKPYLDCVTGVAVNALGHQHPFILQALEKQLASYIHISNLYLVPAQQELASALKVHTQMDKVFFCNSGTEANEGAIKFARKYWYHQGKPEKKEIVSLTKSFHGRTFGAMAATGQDKIKKGFGPMPEGFVSVDMEDVAILEKYTNDNCAAILAEPIMAEGGIIPLEPQVIKLIQSAQAKGILFIADEIQTGLGRIGHFLACEQFGLKPDLVTLAKPLGGGLPLGAVLLKSKVAEAIQAGDHGSTFGGNPLACAAGLAFVNEITKESFLDSIREKSDYLYNGLGKILQEIQPRLPVGPLLGKGFLCGMKIGPLLPTLMEKCFQEGLLVHKAGNNDVLRILPPYNISYAEMDELFTKLSSAFQKC